MEALASHSANFETGRDMLFGTGNTGHQRVYILFLNGCLDNVDLELLFRQAKMARESDAAKMTLVSNDQKPHFMTWDGVAG
jgi:hypothetical protein